MHRRVLLAVAALAASFVPAASASAAQGGCDGVLVADAPGHLTGTLAEYVVAGSLDPVSVECSVWAGGQRVAGLPALGSSGAGAWADRVAFAAAPGTGLLVCVTWRAASEVHSSCRPPVVLGG